MQYMHIAVALTAVLFVGIAGLQQEANKKPQVLTPDQVTNRSQSLIGQNITVEAVVQQGPQACTQIYCGPDNPCCNTCSASVYIGSRDSKIGLKGNELGCSGNSCSMNCTPQTGQKYKIHGLLQGENDRLYLKVNKIGGVQG